MGLMVLSSPAFREGDVLPVQYTQDDLNESPPLAWRNEPRNARTLVLCFSVKREGGESEVQWLVYNVPPFVREFAENETPPGSLIGFNDEGTQLYAGPEGLENVECLFTLYALNLELPSEPVFNWAELQKEMEGRMVGPPASLLAYYPVAFKGSRRRCQATR